MLKVYFAKSNRCSVYTVASVRTELRKRGVDVIEHDSRKTYTDTDLLKSDHLVVLPETLQHNHTNVGKGLASQITTFRKHKPNGKIYIINEKTDKAYWMSECSSLDVMDQNDWVNYGRIFTTSTQMTLNHSMSLLLKEYENERINESSKAYVQSAGSNVLDSFGSALKNKKSIIQETPEIKAAKHELHNRLDDVAKKIRKEAQDELDELIQNNHTNPVSGFEPTGSRVYSRRLILT